MYICYFFLFFFSVSLWTLLSAINVFHSFITPDDDDGDGGDDEFTHYLCSKVVLYQIATFDYSAEYE